MDGNKTIISCPWCLSDNIAWSHETGYILCQSCGAIIEGIVEETSEDSELYGHGIWYLNGKPPKPSRAIERLTLRALRRGKIVSRRNGSLSIDSPANRRARMLVKTIDGLEDALREVELDPILKARTYRSRVAIAYYALLRVNGISKHKAIELVASKIGVSRRTIEATISKYSIRIRSLEDKLRQ
ncbi:MAG: hypothetical protein GSR85_07200 [Desulfurococcales archaeon]|nr:hypothetical protein [Desulfurococcales archaeon]